MAKQSVAGKELKRRRFDVFPPKCDSKVTIVAHTR